MDNYNEIFENLRKNLEHFTFGKNGEGWMTGLDFENGKFKDIDWGDLAQKVSNILGYNIEESKKEDENNEKRTVVSNCNPTYYTVATPAYHTSIDDNCFKLEVLIPGDTINNFRVSVNSKDMKLKVARKDNGENLPWYAACKEPVVVDIPEGLVIDTLKKKSENGLLAITRKIAEQKDFETEI
jgi:HSP20 family molecular chaperone IbpA